MKDGDWTPDPESAQVEARYVAEFNEKMGHDVGYSNVDLESRDAKIRR